MNKKYITGIVILFGLIGMIIYQIFAITTGRVATISVFAETLNMANPLIAHIVGTVFGILVGHWFIPPSCPKCGEGGKS